ncbi:MAG TPA: phosphopantetheine-binding protein [Candidatus Dormibacteraeota bacterium]|nr:phosphopantetheine-binding protein [Candidatus Dormibacteraeota bacterium]
MTNPEAELERALAGIWREVLDLEEARLDENFFDAGGTSALMEVIRRRLEVATGRQVALLALFEHPTIRGLAGHLAGREPGGPAPDVELDRRQGRSRLSRRRAALEMGRAEDTGGAREVSGR